MSRAQRTEAEILNEVLFHCGFVLRYVEMDIEQPVVSDAMAMRIIAAIEAMSHLTPEDRRRLVGEDWPAMWGMRNRLAHGYAVADPRIALATAQQDIPSLISVVEAPLKELHG